MKNKNLIIITGPSGVGKGTVVKKLLAKNKSLWLSISATTRQPRSGEEDGKEYFFLTQEKFKNMIENRLFLEWAEFAGNYYGTLKESVTNKISEGNIVILEIEVEGARQVRKEYQNNLSIFLLPPSKKELERRIRDRASDSEEAILKRLKIAEFEINSAKDFDALVVNQDLDKTVKQILKIIDDLG